MTKTTRKSQSPFERFQNLTKALIAVPKKELQDKLDKHRKEKLQKSTRKAS